MISNKNIPRGDDCSKMIYACSSPVWLTRKEGGPEPSHYFKEQLKSPERVTAPTLLTCATTNYSGRWSSSRWSLSPCITGYTTRTLTEWKAGRSILLSFEDLSVCKSCTIGLLCASPMYPLGETKKIRHGVQVFFIIALYLAHTHLALTW